MGVGETMDSPVKLGCMHASQIIVTLVDHGQGLTACLRSSVGLLIVRRGRSFFLEFVVPFVGGEP